MSSNVVPILLPHVTPMVPGEHLKQMMSRGNRRKSKDEFGLYVGQLTYECKLKIHSFYTIATLRYDPESQQ